MGGSLLNQWRIGTSVSNLCARVLACHPGCWNGPSVVHHELKLLQGQTFRATLLTELVEASRQEDPPARLRQLERRIKAEDFSH